MLTDDVDILSKADIVANCQPGARGNLQPQSRKTAETLPNLDPLHPANITRLANIGWKSNPLGNTSEYDRAHPPSNLD
jgi:hypothetical protein